MPTDKTANKEGADNSDAEKRFSLLLISLYKGVLYKEQDEKAWNDLEIFAGQVSEHFAHIGLRLVVDENEGYAYVTYPNDAETQDDNSLPHLTVKRRLTFIVSLMLALLRRRMAEFDTAGEGTRLIVTRGEITELMRPFMPESTNETKLADKIDATINKVADLGFLRLMKNQDSAFEVMRILKAYIDAQWLQSFDERLSEYQACAKKGNVK